jgi:hypothetical protein
MDVCNLSSTLPIIFSFGDNVSKIITLIPGCVWVYRIYKPNMDEEHSSDADYCNKTVYLFAFWLITTAYIFLGLFTRSRLDESCISAKFLIQIYRQNFSHNLGPML